MTEGSHRIQTSRLILFTTLWLTLFILSVKVSAAWATRSLSLMAESMQTLLVSFSTLLSLYKLIANEHPIRRSVYGHGKWETMILFLLIGFFGFTGLNVWGMSAQQLLNQPSDEWLTFPVQVSLPLIQLLAVVIITSLGLALVGRYQGKQLRSAALGFNARQLLLDVCLTLVVLLGLLGVEAGLVWLDVVLAIVLVLVAVRNCWQVVDWQFPLLVEPTAIAPEILAQIAHQVGGITHCYHIRSRGIVGRYVYIQMHLIIHPEFAGVTSVLVERIKGMIEEQYGPVQVTFYIEDDFMIAANRHRSMFISDPNRDDSNNSEFGDW